MPGTFESNNPATMERDEYDYDTENRMGWLFPLMLIVFAAALYYYFYAGNRNNSVPGAELVVQVEDTVAKPVPGAHRKTVSIHLSDSTEIVGFADGIEKQLVVYITSTNPADSISKNRWFDFDNINFESGSAKLTPESSGQVSNIAAILKSYPSVKIKIGGYTDITGDSAENIKLSSDRAAAVAQAIISAGGNAEQITGTEGYGSMFARAAANAPDEEKKKDRRISINVKTK